MHVLGFFWGEMTDRGLKRILQHRLDVVSGTGHMDDVGFGFGCLRYRDGRGHEWWMMNVTAIAQVKKTRWCNSIFVGSIFLRPKIMRWIPLRGSESFSRGSGARLLVPRVHMVRVDPWPSSFIAGGQILDA
mmetsp:Transcript_2597/g.4612  ORF Transcript_2597/g.4612 Transcript_2597/m.4612 type:complete len:131 (+) Transcript_2597:405-797(+)